MGDFKKNVKTDIKEAVAAREAKSSQNVDTVKTIVGSNKIKDKVISAKVYPETWAILNLKQKKLSSVEFSQGRDSYWSKC